MLPCLFLTKVIDENDESYYSNFVLKGTQFTVYYLTDPSLTEDQVLTTNDDGVVVASDYTKTNAVRTWVFEATDNDQIWKTVTLADGSMITIPMNTIYYDNEHLVSGDPIFVEEGPDAQPIMLIGTYVFEETRTTAGLSKMDSWKWALTNNSADTEFTYSDINRYNEELAIAANNKQTITIKIKKASDNDDKPNYYGSLQGAQFKLEYQDPVTSEWKPATAMDINNTTVDVSVLTTDADGNASSVPMKPGTYRLTELVAPRGHVLMNDQGDAAEIGKPFVLGAMGVENNGKRNFEFYYDYSSNPDLENKTTYIIFDKLGYSENGNIEFVTGATLQLWELDADKNPVTQLKVNDQLNFVTTGERIELYGLTVGTSYRFIEIAAPEGYLLPEGEAAYVDFTVPNSTDPVMLQLENERVPKLRSEARTVDGVKEQLLGTDATINDHFWISDLLPNKHYRFEGKLVDASNPNNVIATQVSEFNTDSVKTEVDVVFTFNSADLEGKTLVVIGELFRDGRSTKVATHYDLADFDESIVIPTIGTFAFDKDKAEDHVYASYILNSGTGVVSDRIDYERLIAGTTYEVETKLVDEAGNVVKTIDGTEITKYRFDAETDNGSIVVETKFNALENQGKTLTVYEYIYSFNDNYEKVLIAQHEDLTDTKQQITVPEIKTTASEEVITAADNEEDYKFVVTDYVEYNHLPANTTFVGIATVMDLETNEELVDENGNTFTAEVEFTTDDTGAGNYSVTIEIPYSLVEGQDIVMFEEVKDTEKTLTIAHHLDWNDTDQTVEFPEIKTNAWFINGDDVTTKNGLKELENFNLVDKVTLSNLEKDKEYVINAEIYVVKADGTYELVVKSDDVTYTATGTNPELVDVEFTSVTLPETDENSKFVIMEYLYDNSVLVGKHFDTTDDDQTVRVPDFHTTATDKTDEDKYLYNDGTQTIVDVFHYDNLTPGVEVKLVTTLVDGNGNELKDAEDNSITKETVFTPEATSGDITIEMTVDGKFFEGQIITVFEDLYENDILVGMHHDLSQETQTVYIPEIKTTASEEVVTADDDSEDYTFVVTDFVEYKNLPANTTFIGTATVMNPETNEALVDENGNTFTVETEFTTDDTGAGNYSVTIEIPYSLIEGKDIVMFEEVKDSENVVSIAHHIDWEDKNQTVEFPEIKTSAWFIEDDTLTKNGLKDADSLNLVDKVTLTNLEKDVEYVINAEIYVVKADGTYELVVKSNDVTYTGLADEFELVDVPFENVVFPETDENSKFVIMEYLYANDVLIGKHFNTTDDEQTIRVPDFHTTAVDKADNDKYFYNSGSQTVVDVFHYDNLTPGVEVRLDTYLVDENGNELKDEAGNRISVETVFTPEETSGDITIEITVDAKFFEGQIITVFEDLYENDVLVGMHHDLSQESQTVYVPGIKTTASYVENKDEEKHSFDLIDVVDYKNFPVGSNMIIYARLMDVETQEIAKDAEGNDLVVRYELTPEVADGTYEIRITVPVDLVKGKTFVFFETAYELVDDEEVLFADHEDWEDEDQTLYIPEIRTNAELANTVIGEDGKINIIDTITYTNLKVGVEYTFVGTLMDLATNEELKDSEGNPVQATATFTPEEANGTIEVIFAVDEADIVGHEVVVFERAYTAYATDDEELIGTHEDWDSEDQTVEVPVEVTVSIFKVDSKNEKVLLKGAEITVFKKDGTVAIDKYGKECIGLTDDNGEITFILLKSKDDEYYVQETKAPAGYHININQFEIDLSENTNYRVDIDVHINDMAIIIPPVNTGDNNHLVLWIAVLSGALLAAGGACFFIFKKKKKADA